MGFIYNTINEQAWRVETSVEQEDSFKEEPKDPEDDDQSDTYGMPSNDQTLDMHGMGSSSETEPAYYANSPPNALKKMQMDFDKDI